MQERSNNMDTHPGGRDRTSNGTHPKYDRAIWERTNKKCLEREDELGEERTWEVIGWSLPNGPFRFLYHRLSELFTEPVSCSDSWCTKFLPKPVRFRENPLVPFFALYLMLNLKLCPLSERMQSLQHPRCENRNLQACLFLLKGCRLVQQYSDRLKIHSDWTFSKWIRENSVLRSQLQSCFASLVVNIKI